MDEIVEQAVEAQRQMAYYQQQAASNYANQDPAKAFREYRITAAINALTEAKRVRADEILMTEIRAWIREKRDDLAGLLDDIGG